MNETCEEYDWSFPKRCVDPASLKERVAHATWATFFPPYLQSHTLSSDVNDPLVEVDTDGVHVRRRE